MSKKIIGLLLACVMVAACFGGCGNVTDTNNKVVLGNVTELSGEFRWPSFTGSNPGAADLDINTLTTGYSTMETNRSGDYVWNKTAVENHTEEEDADGNYVVTIEIKKGLKFSDGTELKAANYVAYVLAFSTQILAQAGGTGKVGQAFVGYRSFNAYVGADVAVEGATKEFAGVRILNDYKFSLTVDAAAGYYPYYYAYTYGAVTPYDIELVVGKDVEVKDDGNGCYLSETWYEKASGSTAEAPKFKRAERFAEAREDISNYPFSGPYTVYSYDDSTKEAVLKINPNYQGNFEGQKPSIEVVVYRKIVSETQLDMLKNGEIDILAGVTGGSDTEAALAAVKSSNGTLASVQYQRAGYGKVQFDCDFGPTMFASVRQAICYVLNTNEFAATFTGGYGSVVYAPYSPDFSMWKNNKDMLEKNMIDYSYSVANAKKVLENDGWVYNSKGEAFVEGQSGVDAVRYKKLTAEEAAACDGVNKTYSSVSNTDGVEYKTVEINGEYYIPLVINWFGTTPNDVTEQLITKLVDTNDVKSLGMVVRSTVGDFTQLVDIIYREGDNYSGTPTYGMFNLATGYTTAVYDYAFNWSLDPDYFGYSVNKLYDEYDVDFPYYDENGNHTKLSYADAVAKSGGKLGMDYLSMAMVYDATTEEEYNEWWAAYILRWNELLPDIPLYSNYYFDIYNTKIQGLNTSPFWSPTNDIIYCTVSVG